jgi:hypothetical protein
MTTGPAAWLVYPPVNNRLISGNRCGKVSRILHVVRFCTIHPPVLPQDCALWNTRSTGLTRMLFLLFAG